MKTTINIHTMMTRETYIIDEERQTFEISGIKVDENADRALSYIKLLTAHWPERLENKNILDGLRCKIILEDKGEKKSFTFINEFPQDFHLLTKYLEGVKSNVSRII